MTNEKKITILNIPDETRKATELLMKKQDCPFTSIEDCISSLMTYRMQLKAMGEEGKVRLLDETYHLKSLSIVYHPVSEGEKS